MSSENQQKTKPIEYCSNCYGGQIATRDSKGRWVTVRCSECNGTGRK